MAIRQAEGAARGMDSLSPPTKRLARCRMDHKQNTVATQGRTRKQIIGDSAGSTAKKTGWVTKDKQTNRST